MRRGRPSKPSCYLEKYRTGYFGLEYTYSWIARDNWNNEVARAKTKKECEYKARLNGYTPR